VKNMLVLGAGKFGRRTVETLIEAGCKVTVVDRDATALKSLSGTNLTAVCAGGIEYLMEEDIMKFDFIIPALPLHVAFEWVAVCLNKMGINCGRVSVPAITVPNPYRGQNGTLYASFAAHLCPPECPEPDGACYLTGEERITPLHKLLAELDVPGFDTEVVQSHQLFPGLGGLKPAELEQLLQKIAAKRRPVIIVTSCACHAVLDALTF
jgi:hypothetical protein